MEIGRRGQPTVDVGNFNPGSREIFFRVVFDVPEEAVAATGGGVRRRRPKMSTRISVRTSARGSTRYD